MIRDPARVIMLHPNCDGSRCCAAWFKTSSGLIVKASSSPSLQSALQNQDVQTEVNGLHLLKNNHNKQQLKWPDRESRDTLEPNC